MRQEEGAAPDLSTCPRCGDFTSAQAPCPRCAAWDGERGGRLILQRWLVSRISLAVLGLPVILLSWGLIASADPRGRLRVSVLASGLIVELQCWRALRSPKSHPKGLVAFGALWWLGGAALLLVAALWWRG